MSRVSASRGTTRASTSTRPTACYDTNGNPTPTLSEPLKDGGQFAPQSGGSGSGSIYINAKWQFNANAHVPGAVRHRAQRQRVRPPGLPVPAVPAGHDRGARRRLDAVGAGHAADRLRSATTNLWNTDLRAAKAFKFNTVTVRGDRSTRSTCSTRTRRSCGTTTSRRRRSTRSRRT